ncbi:MAG: hypothetical protein ACLSG5_12650 [Oscillospiraceae bacterium]
MKYKRIAALAAAAALLTGCAEIPDRNMSRRPPRTAEASAADTAEVFDEIPAKQYPREQRFRGEAQRRGRDIHGQRPHRRRP